MMLLDIRDAYSNLTSKLVASLLWLDRKRVGFEFLFKGDDDTFVRLDFLVSELRTMTSRSLLYWGFFDGRARVKKSGEWGEQK